MQDRSVIKFPHGCGGATDYCDCGNWSGSHCRERSCARPLSQRQELAALRAETPVGGEVWAFLDVASHDEARRVMRAALDAANAVTN